jgi:hypothetical protein
VGGWEPERFPLYLRLHPHPDPELLLDLMLVIRDTQRRKD